MTRAQTILALKVAIAVPVAFVLLVVHHYQRNMNIAKVLIKRLLGVFY